MTGDEDGNWAAPLSVPHCFVHVSCCRGFSYMYILLLLNKPNLKKTLWNLCPQIGLSSKGWLIGLRRDLPEKTPINEECWSQCGLLLTSGGVKSMSLMQFLVRAAAHFLSAFDLPLISVSNPSHFWRDLRSCSSYSFPPLHVPFLNTILSYTSLL